VITDLSDVPGTVEWAQARPRLHGLDLERSGSLEKRPSLDRLMFRIDRVENQLLEVDRMCRELQDLIAKSHYHEGIKDG